MKKNILLLLLFNCFLAISQERVKPFIPEIVEQFPNVRDVAISPNGEEIMFTAQNISGTISSIIKISKNKNGWNSPEIASFSGRFFDLEPFFSPDGLKLYFASKRPLNTISEDEKDFDIWFVERTNVFSNWSEPKNIGSPINSELDEFFPSVATNGNLYFTQDNPTLNTKDDIYVSEFKIGQYTTPKALPTSINSNGYEYNAFISPDETFIIFGSYNRTDGLGSGDLYISFNSESGWSNAENLGIAINTNKMDYCPFVDLKTNTLYFTSKLDNSKLTFDKPLKINELLDELNRYDNGLSRLYYASIDTILKNKIKE